MSSRLSRATLTMTISELLGDSKDNTLDYFEPDRENSNSIAELRIPEHQRYYVWPDGHRPSLIDSVMSNFPMPLIVITEHIVNNNRVRYIQDGQQRLTTLQHFIQGKFSWNNKYFDNLDSKEKRTFLSYKLVCEIINDPNEEQVAEIFERLNKGKPLTDNDKFFNRRSLPIISFIINELIEDINLKDNFRKFTRLNVMCKSRVELSDIVGAVASICSDNVKNITTSYERIGPYLLKIVLTEELKSKVIKTFTNYFAYLKKSMRAYNINKPKKCYLKLSNVFGVWLYWYLLIQRHENNVEKRNSLNILMWFANEVQQGNERKREIFQNLPVGDQRNLNDASLKARTEHLLSLQDATIDFSILGTESETNSVCSNKDVSSGDVSSGDESSDDDSDYYSVVL